jgi:hypothetical protein
MDRTFNKHGRDKQNHKIVIGKHNRNRLLRRPRRKVDVKGKTFPVNKRQTTKVDRETDGKAPCINLSTRLMEVNG